MLTLLPVSGTVLVHLPAVIAAVFLATAPGGMLGPAAPLLALASKGAW